MKPSTLRLWAQRVAQFLSSIVYGVLSAPLAILNEMFNIKGIISVCVYIAVIPLIMSLLEGLSTSLTGTAGALVSAIIALVPLMLVVKVLDKLDF